MKQQNRSSGDLQAWSVYNETTKSTEMKKKIVKREFRDIWLKQYPWLEFDGHKMSCKNCVSEGKDNPFTSGCTNFRHSTLVRHMSSSQHKAAVEAVSLRTTLHVQAMSSISKENSAVVCALRSIYRLSKEQLLTLKHKLLLNYTDYMAVLFQMNLRLGQHLILRHKQLKKCKMLLLVFL